MNYYNIDINSWIISNKKRIEQVVAFEFQNPMNPLKVFEEFERTLITLTEI